MNADPISFFTPVTFGTVKTRAEYALEKVDSYFSFGGKRAEVLPDLFEKREKNVRLTERAPSLLISALKVASYCTVVPPLLLLPVKAILRSQMRFSPSEENLEKKLQEIEQKRTAIEVMRARGLGRGITRNKEKVAAIFSRVKRHFLSVPLFEEAKLHIDRLEKTKSSNNPYKLPQANDGKTQVFLPPQLPLVLKRSGKLASKKRARQTRVVLDLCEGNCLHHLVIPRQRVYKEFVLETRLPIAKNCLQGQMEIYLENRDLFGAAAKEFTQLLFLSEMSDVLDEGHHPLTIFGPIGRHDNFPLFVEEGLGKVGLVDLEHFIPISKISFSSDEVMCRCKNAIAIFPCHFEEILEAARGFSAFVDEKAFYEELTSFRDRAQNVLVQAYERHLYFFKKNGISFEDPLQPVEVTSTRKKSVKEAVFSRILRQELQEPILRAFESKRERLEKNFSKLVDLIMDFLFDSIDLKESISSYGQLMYQRALYFGCENQRMRDSLVEDVATKIEGSDRYLTDVEALARLLVKEIFIELAVGGELAFYDSGEQLGVECIFF